MTTYVAVFAMLLAYVALVAAYLALRTLAKVRRAAALAAARGAATVESLLVAEDTTTVSAAAPERGALRNIALVRYDAFDEMSGRMSFSLALLDDEADGVVISAIAAPTDTRVYAKGVAAGKGEHDLSPEETQAVTSALRGRGGLLRRKAG